MYILNSTWFVTTLMVQSKSNERHAQNVLLQTFQIVSIKKDPLLTKGKERIVSWPGISDDDWLWQWNDQSWGRNRELWTEIHK